MSFEVTQAFIRSSYLQSLRNTLTAFETIASKSSSSDIALMEKTQAKLEGLFLSIRFDYQCLEASTALTEDDKARYSKAESGLESGKRAIDQFKNTTGLKAAAKSPPSKASSAEEDFLKEIAAFEQEFQEFINRPGKITKREGNLIKSRLEQIHQRAEQLYPNIKENLSVEDNKRYQTIDRQMRELIAMKAEWIDEVPREATDAKTESI
jgi:ElaB/YqjD/DUF883 family membrane-anchored ribosome-binding protein